MAIFIFNEFTVGWLTYKPSIWGHIVKTKLMNYFVARLNVIISKENMINYPKNKMITHPSCSEIILAPIGLVNMKFALEITEI